MFTIRSFCRGRPHHHVHTLSTLAQTQSQPSTRPAPSPNANLVKHLYASLLRESQSLDNVLNSCESPIGVLELKYLIASINPSLPANIHKTLEIRSPNVLYWNRKPVTGQVQVAVRNIFRQSLVELSSQQRRIDVCEDTHERTELLQLHHTTQTDWISRGLSALRAISTARYTVQTSNDGTKEAQKWRKLIALYGPMDVTTSKVPIEIGALIISVSADRNVSSDNVVAQLDAIAFRVKKSLSNKGQRELCFKSDELSFEDELEVIHTINHVLFDSMLAFSDIAEANPKIRMRSAHSLLHTVLEEKQGLPATLALIYIAVGQRMGINVHALALPGLVVVQPRTWQGHPTYGDKYINVCQGGSIVDKNWCKDAIAQNTSCESADKPAFFEPVHPLVLHTRILYNLVIGAKSADKEAHPDHNQQQIALSWLDQFFVLMDEVKQIKHLEPEQMA